MTHPRQYRCCQTWDPRIEGTVNKPQMPHPLLSLCQAPDGALLPLTTQTGLGSWSRAWAGWEPEGLDLIHLSPTQVRCREGSLIGRGLGRVTQQGHPKSLGVLKTDAGLLPPTVHFPAKPENWTGHTQCWWLSPWTDYWLWHRRGHGCCGGAVAVPRLQRPIQNMAG